VMGGSYPLIWVCEDKGSLARGMVMTSMSVSCLVEMWCVNIDQSSQSRWLVIRKSERSTLSSASRDGCGNVRRQSAAERQQLPL
jgi:hypothetical protein